MNCKSCGKKVDINKKFCTNCGWKIEVPVAKEEVKKVIPKEPVKKEIKNENKEVYVSNKSSYKKQGSFFEKLSSNLKQQSVKSKVEKNILNGKTKQSVSLKMEKNKVVDNKGNKFNYVLVDLLGIVSIGCVLWLAQYIGSVEYNDDRYSSNIYDSNNQDLKFVTITCSDNNVSFRSNGKYGDWYYAEGANKKRD